MSEVPAFARREPKSWPADAIEIKILTARALATVLDKIGHKFEQQSGHKLNVDSGFGAELDLISHAESGSMGSAIRKARELRASGVRAAVDFENLDPSGSGSAGKSTVSVQGEGKG